jgi:hypothetical protein
LAVDYDCPNPDIDEETEATVMAVNDVIRLAQIVVWPLVVLMLALVYHREIPKLFQALSGKISKLSAVGLTLEFASAGPSSGTLLASLDQIRQPASTGPPPPSGVQSLVELARSSPAADYLVIDLRAGDAWLTSRLYLFATVLPKVLSLRCFVFIGDWGPVPRYFLGMASPELVVSQLEAHDPCLPKAMTEAQLQPVVAGESPNRYVQWWPPNDTVKADLKQLTQGPAVDTLDTSRAGALDKIVRELVRPIDLLQPGQVEIFVQRFLQSPAVRRSHDARADSSGWVQLDTHDEHAEWIKDERQLIDLFDGGLSRQKVSDPGLDDDALVKAVLRQQGEFVALTDAEGRFDRLVDRAALLERVVRKI